MSISSYVCSNGVWHDYIFSGTPHLFVHPQETLCLTPEYQVRKDLILLKYKWHDRGSLSFLSLLRLWS